MRVENEGGHYVRTVLYVHDILGARGKGFRPPVGKVDAGSQTPCVTNDMRNS